MPEWYSRRKTFAERIYRQNKAARYGPDINLNSYDVEAPARDEIAILPPVCGDSHEE